ncbi:MAG: S8 family serine peptidase [Rhizomicrobium sp.]
MRSGYTNAESDLGVYRAQWGLPACTTQNGCFKKLNQKGKQKKYPAQNIGWAQESALDLDMASAMCPNCQIWLVEGNTNSFKNLYTAVDTAAKLGAHVISNSYSGGEAKGEKKIDPHYDHPGVAITASTGDGGYGVGYPASSPHVIAVGGTQSRHRRQPSAAGRKQYGTARAAVAALCSPKPSWQTDPGCSTAWLATYRLLPTRQPALQFTDRTIRACRPGSFSAAPASPHRSSAACSATMAATVSDASTIYAHAGNLFDVTSGSNGSCSPAYFCTGEVGYDGPTGLGTPNGTTAFGD